MLEYDPDNHEPDYHEPEDHEPEEDYAPDTDWDEDAPDSYVPGYLPPPGFGPEQSEVWTQPSCTVFPWPCCLSPLS